MQHTSYCNLELELQPTMIWLLVSQPPIALTTSSNDAAHSTLRPPDPTRIRDQQARHDGQQPVDPNRTGQRDQDWGQGNDQ